MIGERTKIKKNIFTNQTETSTELSFVNNPTVPFYNRIPCLKPLLIILLIQFLIFIVFSVVISPTYFIECVSDLKNLFEYEYQNNIFRFLIIYFICCSISISFVFPTISLSVILFTLVTRKIFFSWIVSLINYLIIESIIYMVANTYLKAKIRNYVRSFR